ncbi:MAG: TetR/AcrR family transcriptional regulator [Clostridiales bacterium]|uniref:TetR/AcrR family transcriptional regulator n=1 Tax=Flavonifractor porci TaxID=3133422 RepID=UPI0030A1486A|nr:TetR/AcrR family transcriptional regulator [Clostridiales bacterium]
MSYCSDLTKERIMDCARAEFLKKGFRETQLKDIAAAAKVTTGAIYRHFENKEDLFYTLVKEVYEYTLDIMDHIEEHTQNSAEDLQNALQADSIEQSYRMAMEFVQYMYEHLAAFQLLLKCSAGSKVENFIEDASLRYTKRNLAFTKKMHENGIAHNLPNELDIHIITTSYITAICECILHDVPHEQAGQYVHNIITFHHYGWYGLLGIKQK